MLWTKRGFTFIGASFSSVSEALFPVFKCEIFHLQSLEICQTASNKFSFINDRLTNTPFGWFPFENSYKAGWICADLGGEAVWGVCVGSAFASHVKFYQRGTQLPHILQKQKHTGRFVEMSEVKADDAAQARIANRQMLRPICNSPVIFEYKQTNNSLFLCSTPHHHLHRKNRVHSGCVAVHEPQTAVLLTSLKLGSFNIAASHF